MNIKLLLFTLIFLFVPIVAAAQQDTVLGKWKTIDDTTGEVKSLVQIYEQKGKLYGKIVKLFPKPEEDPDPICDKCSGDEKNKKILGMLVIRGLTKKGDVWSDGKLLDPDNGKVYDGKVWLEQGKLKVRGYLLFFYRTQTWVPFVE